ncbi:MAG: F-type H+-transporting ATPase subunit epsilon [Frankiaceae bacterium]|jgi:F-type H+-transporting ATPase subunit epsilon|nr:F-type H+-transporting ATPase subunit epsilon [Frankiaceae bacterium]
MQVELVSAERRLWSGEAEMVVARTTEGEIGILPGHAPMLGELGSGVLRIIQGPNDEVTAAIHGGFLSVAATGVSILADIAELAPDIDLQRAHAAYDRAVASLNADDDAPAREAVARAAARLRAAGQPVA